jgi:hypothetical protein
LDEAPGGYEIHDWLAFYPTRETVARRSRWRREKRTVRASADNRHSDGHTDQISGSSSVGLQPSASASVQRRADADEDQDPEQNGQKGNPEWFAQQLRGSDARTASAIRSVMRRHRLGEAALHEALEIVRERKPRNEPGYFVRCLQDIGERKAVA